MGQPKRIENVKVMVANTPMDTDKIKVNEITHMHTHTFVVCIGVALLVSLFVSLLSGRLSPSLCLPVALNGCLVEISVFSLLPLSPICSFIPLVIACLSLVSSTLFLCLTSHTFVLFYPSTCLPRPIPQSLSHLIISLSSLRSTVLV